MRLHRFYVEQKIVEGEILTINSTELVHQVRRVFRLRPGDQVIVFNGTGFDYECNIDSYGEGNKIGDDSAISLLVVSSRPSRFSPKRRLFLCTAIVKKDTFEWIVEKATELGVTDIIPIEAERSEKKALNEDRLRKIVIEACEQSGRGTTPMVHQIMGLGEAAEFLKKEKKGIQILAFHTNGEKMGIVEKSRLQEASPLVPLAIFIGPEGGWSEKEIELFHAQSVQIFCLGAQILRTETAVIATLSRFVFDD